MKTAESKAKTEGNNFSQEDALLQFENKMSPLYQDSSSDADRQKAEEFMREFGLTGDDLERFVKSGEPLAAVAALADVRRAEAKIEICDSGAAVCEKADLSHIIDPQKSFVFVQSVLKAVSQLYAEGAFEQSPRQQAFASNILAGARFFGIWQPVNFEGPRTPG